MSGLAVTEPAPGFVSTAGTAVEQEEVTAMPAESTKLKMRPAKGRRSTTGRRACSGWCLRTAAISTTLLVWGSPVPASAITVVMFDNPQFVDSGSDSVAAEATNVRIGLEALGHDVEGYGAIGAVGVTEALEGARVAVIPELELRRLSTALGAGARQAYRAYVESGGGLVVMATSGQEAAALLNRLFGWQLSSGAVGTGLLGAGAHGTGYAGGPESVAENSRSRGLDISSLPTDARVVYSNGTRANVARFTVAGGRVAYLGWDWFDAAPAGSQDGGWLAVLDRAVVDAGACGDTGAGDADGDGIADECDPDDSGGPGDPGDPGDPDNPFCTDVDGARIIDGAPRIVLRNVGRDADPSNDSLVVSGTFSLPAGGDFGSIDPQSKPFAIVLTSAAGVVRVAVSLPKGAYGGNGTRGWRLSRRGRKWTYFDETSAPVGGIVSAQLLDRATEAPGRVEFSVVGRDGSYPLGEADAPLRSTVIVGDGVLGECAWTEFRAFECRLGRRATRFKCTR